MKNLRVIAMVAVWAAWGMISAVAQDDSARDYFSAYQEFQRAERLEREGRTADAIAKFRYVATQLSQIKAQAPDWQPMVIDFRLGKTKEAIVRLEGSLDSPTLGPPPDLPMPDGEEDVLPPVRPSRRDSGGAPPTISISPGEETPGSSAVEELPREEVAGGEGQRLRDQLASEKSRNEELRAQVQQGEADLSNVSMELEKTKVVVVDLTTELRNLKEAGGVPAEASDAVKAELAKLTETAKELEAIVAAAAAEKEELSGRIAESAKELEELTVKVEKAEARTAEVETERETLAASRDEAVKAAEEAKAEVQTLAGRLTELEEERTQLIASRDEAQQQAAEAKTALEKSADLIEANRLLEEKLAQAATQIEGMTSDASTKETVIAGLQSDLDTVRAELVSAQNKLRDDRARFDQLQLANDQLLKQYDEVTGAMAAVQLGDVTAAEATLIQQENEVLRGIIMRQIKEQARREQAHRLAQEEMERLEIRSDSLNDKINALAKPTLQLTTAEQEMLKRPVVTVLEASAGQISAQVELLKPRVDDVAAGEGEVTEDVTESVSEVVFSESATAESSVGAAGEAVAGETVPATEGAAAASSLGTELPIEVMTLIAEARDQFVRGNFAAAEKLYQQFVELNPNSVVALANLGVSQFRQGKLTAAQLALEKAIGVDPNDAFSLTTLGAVMIEQSRIQDAINYLERANESRGDDPITLNYLGVASSQLGQFGKAEQSLRRAITVDPGYAEAHFNLAVIYATAKPPSIALAKRHYEKALELGAGPDTRLASMLQADPGS